VNTRLTKLVFVGAIVAVGCIIWTWFYVLPRNRFSLGMNEAGVRKAAFGSCEIVPLGTAMSAPPTELELLNTPCYLIRVPAMGVAVHLNSYKKVVHVSFLFGKDIGTLVLVTPRE